MQKTATELCHVSRISDAIEDLRLRKGGFTSDGATAEGRNLQERLLAIWRRVLGNPRIAPSDNFFEAGGTSLKAVLTVAAIRRELGIHLTIISLFECPTVRLLALKFEAGPPREASTGEALLRGSRRKLKTRKRG
jgi:hypothetical protein